MMNTWLSSLSPRLRTLILVGVWSAIIGALFYFVIRGLGRVDQQHLGDFRHFYWAAEAMLHGHNPYESGVVNGEPRNGYIYPPLIAFLYMPLAYFSMPVAAKISMIINILLMCGAMTFMARAYLEAVGQKISPLCMGVVLSIASVLIWDKFKSELQMLQTNMLTLFAWSVALYNLRRRPWLAGLALGFAFNIKYLVLALIPYLIVRRQFRTIAYMLLGIVIFALLPSVFTGLPKDLEYLTMAFGGIARLVGISIDGVVADVEPLSSGFSLSLPAALARIVERNPWLPSPLLIAGGLFAAWNILMIALYRREGIPFIRGPRNSLTFLAEFTVLTAITLVFSPQTNMRHTVLTAGASMLAVVMILFSDIRSLRPWLIAATLLMLAGLTLPPGMRENEPSYAAQIWFFYGGAMWCVLISCSVILYSALRAEKLTPRNDHTTDRLVLKSIPPPIPIPSPPAA